MHAIPFYLGCRYSEVNALNYQVQWFYISVVYVRKDNNHDVNAEWAHNYGCIDMCSIKDGHHEAV